MSKILVTGGAGFIGSNLCEALRDLGHDVTSLDNYFTGNTENHVDGVYYYDFSTNLINEVFENETFDIVYHLGEYSRVEQSFEDIEAVWEFNKLGTYEVLKYVARTKAKLIYAGSSTKFADDSDGYVQSPYAWSKASNTELVKQYAEWYGLDYAITYFYNVYGNKEISDGNYATLIAKYKLYTQSGLSLPVVLPGTQVRNFTHIEDIVDALILIGEQGSGDEYGIGHPDGYTIQEVANMFSPYIEYLEPRKGNRMTAPVITEKTTLLGWAPKHNLPDYIKSSLGSKL